MLVLDNDDIICDHEGNEREVPPPQKEENLEEDVQTKEEDIKQRESIFHTRCRVENEVCSLIINTGSFTNVACNFLINKIGLKNYKHPNPYQLHWLNNEGELKVIHDGYMNCYSFKHQDKIVNLTPLTLEHVRHDQMQLKKYIENSKAKLEHARDKGKMKVTHDKRKDYCNKERQSYT
ncbi:hypothetical protein GQ457_01G022030 [Hibiscus cannabinus]